MLTHRISLCLCFSFFIDAFLSKNNNIYFFMFMAMEVNLGLGETLKVSYTGGTQLQFYVGCWGVIEGQMYIAVMSTHFTSQVTYSPS